METSQDSYPLFDSVARESSYVIAHAHVRVREHDRAHVHDHNHAVVEEAFAVETSCSCSHFRDEIYERKIHPRWMNRFDEVFPQHHGEDCFHVLYYLKDFVEVEVGAVVEADVVEADVVVEGSIAVVFVVLFHENQSWSYLHLYSHSYSYQG